MENSERTKSFWGWGYQDELSDPQQQKRHQQIGMLLNHRFGTSPQENAPPPSIGEIELPEPRISLPDSLSSIGSSSTIDRASHTYGKSFRDIVRGLRRDFSAAPDVVAFPETEEQVASLLDWASNAAVAAIPYGGGSSVVGGVEANVGDAYSGTLSIDLKGLGRIQEIDKKSRAARIQAGIFGPALEAGLRPHGLTLRHFPQSFEFSTLGGWIATRSGGHYATLYTHIDDFVESTRTVTPSGIMESRRLPGSGAGPSPDRLMIGSEGTLGIITEAWMRLQDRPKFRASASVTFDDYASATQCVRTISQTGLYPTNLRLLDAGEALMNGAADGSKHVLIVGFESADHELDAWMERALECCRDHGGIIPEGSGKTRTDEAASREGAAGAWRKAFLNAPYLRDAITAMGFISETFETAITWDRFAEFHRRVTEATEIALAEICGGGTVTCRFTHVYPDGPAPYFTILAPSTRDRQLEQWNEIKAAVSEVLIDAGGTITHHHAVGRDHRPWYDRQRPELFATALRATKRTLDPQAVLNPGVLIDP
jgi:alkyldihydroxyacetonephosphate synthase